MYKFNKIVENIIKMLVNWLFYKKKIKAKPMFMKIQQYK